MRRNFVLAIGLMLVTLSATPRDGHADPYGGIDTLPVDAGTGFFRVEKVGPRWMFVTPDGNAHWMLGVFNVDGAGGTVDDLGSTPSSRIIKKYGSSRVWAEQTVKRLRAWGFNTLAEYASLYVLPTSGNPEKMPFVALMRPSFYGLTNKWNLAPGPFKDLISATDPAIYTYYRGGTTPDVFDPNFDAYVNGWMATIYKDRIGSPWLIGIATDDADNLFGFGPSAEIAAARLHPHIAWLALIANPVQAKNVALGVTYASPKLYTKYALLDFLRARYGTIAALNTAWGAGYTTFETSGGWPSGRGLLDESGRSAWVGKDHAGRMAEPAVLRDLDDFLYQYARRYFSVVAGRIRQHAPQHLVFGPATLNGWSGLTHRSILRAAGEYVDVLQAITRTQQVLDLTSRYAGDVPLIGWTGMVANADSALWRYPYRVDVTPVLPTQEERGARYAATVHHDLHATTASGNKPIVGIKLWSWADMWREKANWGLVTQSDNAYDGTEATRAARVDEWGYRTGGEELDYGDFITSVRTANTAVHDSLAEGAVPIASMVIDNATAGVWDASGGRVFTGTWCQSTASGSYGTRALVSCGVKGGAYRWTPRIPAAGVYDVYAWWPAHAKGSPATQYLVNHALGVARHVADQRTRGAQWNLLGRYTFQAGTAGWIAVNDGNGLAVADAIQLVPAQQ